MNAKKTETSVKAMLDLIETFLVVLKEFKKSSAEIIPMMIDCQKGDLANVFESALSYFEHRFGEHNENITNLSVEEIAFHHGFIAQLCAWMRFWAISITDYQEKFEKFEDGWKTTFSTAFDIAMKKNDQGSAEMFRKLLNTKPGEKLDAVELTIAINKARELIAGTSATKN